MIICTKEKCTGCGVCVDVCEKQAIIMKPDRHGFFYPEIIDDICINCSACQRKCPALAEEKNDNYVRSIYAAWNKNKGVRKTSSSGGVFSVLVDHALCQSGVVAGAMWNENYEVHHTIIDSKKDMFLLRGSKYLQSHTDSIYAKVKECLLAGKKVLFSGTPCQNHALKNYLGKNYDDLITVDVICHGVPSDRVFQRYLNERSENGKREIKQIRFRHKKPYWDWCNVTIDYENGQPYSVSTTEDSYYTLFNIGYSLRPSCSQCKYASQTRIGDITLADFWGFLPKGFKMHRFLLGVSLVMINTPKGESVFDQISQSLVFQKASLEDALLSNKALCAPFAVPHEKSIAFWNDFEAGMSIDQLRDKYAKNTIMKPSGFSLIYERLYKMYRWTLRK